ncbi:MAG: BlaI/MecI/CopY family transcriptional regulator [Phycisphaerae bacterium]
MAGNGMHITPAELRVMNVIWRLEAGTVREVKDELVQEGGDPPAYTTVMTLMNQLAGKGALHVDKARQPFIYRPAVRREKVQGQRLKQLLHTMFDGQAGELVMRLVEEASLSPEDLKRIETKIEAREGGKASGRGAPSAKSKRKNKS